MLHQEFRRLEIGRQLGLGRRLDHPAPGETDGGPGLGDDQVADARVAGHHPRGRRVGEHADVRQALLGMVGQRAAGLGHLHEAEHAFVHACPAAGGDDDQRDAPVGRRLDESRELLAHHRAHGASQELEIHHTESHPMGPDAAHAGDHGVLEHGHLLPVGGQLGLVAGGPGELQHVDALHEGVHLLERAGLHQGVDALPGPDLEVIGALRADLEVGIEVLVVDQFIALGALGPKALRDVPLLGLGGQLGLGEERGVRGIVGWRSDCRLNGIDADRLFADDFGGHERGNAPQRGVTSGNYLSPTCPESQRE